MSNRGKDMNTDPAQMSRVLKAVHPREMKMMNHYHRAVAHPEKTLLGMRVMIQRRTKTWQRPYDQIHCATLRK